MMPIERKGGITRRSFFQGTVKAVAGAGALAAVNSITPARAGVRETSSSDPADEDALYLHSPAGVADQRRSTRMQRAAVGQRCALLLLWLAFGIAGCGLNHKSVKSRITV
jgi:hypothetical protein